MLMWLVVMCAFAAVLGFTFVKEAYLSTYMVTQVEVVRCGLLEKLLGVRHHSNIVSMEYRYHRLSTKLTTATYRW